MTPLDRILAALEARDCRPRKSGDGYKALCPVHDDRNPSLSFTEGDDGRVLIYCQAECPTDSVLSALNMTAAELFPEPERKTIVKTYDYVDEHGELLYQAVRYQPKEFRQRHPNGNGDWAWNMADVRRVLYRLPEVLAAVERGDWIAIVEGEKDADRLAKEGIVATTNVGGAGKWLPSYTATLRGANVAIFADSDDPGRKHALRVATALDGIARRLKLYEPAVGYKDITEQLDAGVPLKDRRPFDEGAAAEEPAGLEVLSIKQIMALPTLDEAGNLLGPLIYRGHRVVVGGHTGNGKTSLSLQMVAAACKGQRFLDWTGRGEIRALVIDVEQSVPTIKLRIKEAGITEKDPIFYLRIPDGLALDRDQDARDKIEKLFVDGRYDIVLADPLYKLSAGDPNDARAAIDLMRRFDDWRERFEFALLLPMHCRKPHPQSKLSVHDLFGSSGYQWGAEILMGIQRVNDGYGFVHWWKDREGMTGVKIDTKWGVIFDRDHGFVRDPNDGKQPPAIFRIRDLLEAAPDGLRIKDLKAETMLAESTIRKSVRDLMCTRDDERLKAVEQRWILPASLFVSDGVDPPSFE